MGKFHSLDVRERVVSMVDSGQSRRPAARLFCVSESAAIKLLRRRAVTARLRRCGKVARRTASFRPICRSRSCATRIAQRLRGPDQEWRSRMRTPT